MLRVAEQYAATDTGLQRRANEDALLARSPLFVVADGMGGAQAGEVASKIAIEAFEQGLGDTSEPEGGLAARAGAANARIHELSHSSPEHAGMGTTLTAAYVAPEEVAIAHVGDSRAYRLRDGELERLTDDHSLVDELMRQGKITAEEAVDHPQRSVITRALGPEPAVEVDTRSYAARTGDVYLLCSDGLTTMVSEERLAKILSSHSVLRDAGETLIAAANQAGGRDNITVVLFRLEDVSGPPGGEQLPPEPLTQEQNQVANQVAPEHAEHGEVGPAVASATALASRPTSAGASPGAPPVRALRPRLPTQAQETARTGRWFSRRRLRPRRLVPVLVVLVVLGMVAAAGYLTLESVYFIGTNSRGLVTLYRGVPYQLPGGIKLYSTEYVSGVAASSLSPARRRTLLDHTLRSESDAGNLLHSLELGQLSE
jgi:PPM family protein phosphatase